MSSRKLGYVISVVLLAGILSAPHLMVGSAVGRHIYLNRMLMPLPGLGWVAHGGGDLSHARFWKDRFVNLHISRYGPDGNLEWSLRTTDPETGAVKHLDAKLSEHFSSRFSLWVFGQRLFAIATVGREQSFELADGALQPSLLKKPASFNDAACFIWNEDCAVVESTKSGFALLTFEEGDWKRLGKIVVPEPDPTAEEIASRRGFFIHGLLECHNQGDRIHQFLNLKGRLYYREGIELKAEPIASFSETGRQSLTQEEPAESADALRPHADLAGWTLVHSSDADVDWSRFSFQSQGFLGMFVDGKPAALFVDRISSTNPISRCFRFDGQHWTEFASQSLPIGTITVRAVTRVDQMCSYVVVSTSTGTTHVYAVDSHGMRKTNASSPAPVHAIRSLGALLWYPSGALVWAILLGTSTWGLMWWYTRPDYEFGVQLVKLASLGWRGAARLIDLGFIGAMTAALGWLMLRDFDWLVPLEAFNLQLDHPSIQTAIQIAAALVGWVIALMAAMIVTQAMWGVTPGKWLCRLRTVRTSLRPCGFASSLAREIVFFVDSGDLFLWAPGILSIAFTDHRQRLGDLVADTIVVNADSLRQDVPH